MPAWWDTSTGHDFGLTAAGVQIVDHVPLDESPIRWEETGPDGIGTMSFLVEDTNGSVKLNEGMEVRLTDNVNARTLFGGVLLERRRRRGPGSVVWTECEVASYDWFLDHRIVPRYESKRNVGNRVRKIERDRNIVVDLVRRRGGPIEAFYSDIDATNTDMPLLKLSGETLRSALEKVADEASPGDGEANSATALARHFYVDFDRRLHYFKGTEGLAAPFRISDGSYVRDVITTSGLVEYWSLREEGGSTFYGSEGVTSLDRDSQIAVQADVGVVNELAYRASTFDGVNTMASAASVAGLKVGGAPWSFECWLRCTNASGTDWLLLTFAAVGENGPSIQMEADGDIVVARRGGGSTSTTDQPLTPNVWHHLVVTVSGAGAVKVYVDGVASAGPGTLTGWGDTWDSFNVARVPDGFVGDMQHVAWYSTALSASTVLAHYQQGVSIMPDGFFIETDAGDDVHKVYVRGANAKGSGWVDEKGSPWDLGSAHAYVDARHAKTVRAKLRRGRSYMRRHQKVTGGGFGVLNLNGWRANQLLPVTDDALGLDGATYALRSVRGELSAGSLPTYDIEFGNLSRMLTRTIRRRKLGDIVLP